MSRSWLFAVTFWRAGACGELITKGERSPVGSESIGGSSQVLSIEAGKQLMADEIAWALGHGDTKFLFSFGKAPGLNQSMAQEGMNSRLKIKQTQGLSSRADRLIKAAGAEVDGSELRVDDGVLRIGQEGFLEKRGGSLKITQFCKGAGDSLIESIA